ncbi:unnamed protein product [Cuscuta campestris]|uniref:Reverse transcriptase zinc-binding domain-containing protein n=1 Tax=Cuscuta campestris TaxID=132261 RepID=A0A484KKK3_9ASTE|nr:unnamed protein product [Cuscuta campestris]
MAKGKKKELRPPPPTPPNKKELRNFLRDMEVESGGGGETVDSVENVDKFPVMTEEDFTPCSNTGDVTVEEDDDPESQTPSLDEERFEQELQKDKPGINNGDTPVANAEAPETAEPIGKENCEKETGNNDGNVPGNKVDTPAEKKSFASLFEKNRSEDKGMKLHQVEMTEDEEVFIQPEDVTPMEELWGPCLFWGPNSLSKIASKLGRPLFTDGLTNKVASKLTVEKDPEDNLAYKKPNFCRVLIHMDLSKPPPSCVKVNFVGGSYSQFVEYEDLLLYCYHCEKFGHTPFDCAQLFEMERKKEQEEQRDREEARVEVLKTTPRTETRDKQDGKLGQDKYHGKQKEGLEHTNTQKAHANPDEPSPSFTRKDDNDGFTLKTFHITFVFALYNVSVRRNLWDRLTDIAGRINTPWAIMGDFNAVLDSSERINCHTYAYDMTDLLQFRLNNDLLDAKATALIEQATSLRKKATFYSDAERSFFLQKVKCTFINEGDKCPKFFHAMMKKGDKDSVTVLANTIQNFSQVSFPEGKLPVRYLGLPLTSERASERDFAPLIAKVDENIRKWNTKSLSSAGILELIRSVIQGIEGFWFQAFPIHKSVLDRITTLCRAFFWGSKFCKVAWDDICKPKDEGGLGLRNSTIWNQVLLAKCFWNIAANKETLWIQWVHSVYLQGSDFWTWNPSKKDSHFFKKIAEIRDSLLQKCGDRFMIEDNLGNVDSVNVLAKAINIFSQVSGLHVNPLKSNIFLAGEIKDRTEDILALVPFPQGKLPVRYLGLPLTSQRASERDFAPLVNKVDEHIRKWNAKTLSAAGRLELIRSVIQGIEGFWFQAFPIHKSVLDRITSLCRTFLWGSKFCKVAWEDICKPKDEGGLGLNQPCIWNQALLSKNLWNIASNKETLWVQCVHSVYLDGNDFWTWSPGKKDSHFFKILIEIRDMLLLKIPTKTSLHFIAMENRLCELCHKEEETGQHLFFSCETSTLIWNAVRSWLEIAPAQSTLDRALTWLRRLRNNHCSKRKMTRLAILSTTYHIWRLRNGVYFDNQAINTDAIVCKIKRANTGVPWVTGVIPMPSFSGSGNISNVGNGLDPGLEGGLTLFSFFFPLSPSSFFLLLPPFLVFLLFCPFFCFWKHAKFHSSKPSLF